MGYFHRILAIVYPIYPIYGGNFLRFVFLPMATWLIPHPFPVAMGPLGPLGHRSPDCHRTHRSHGIDGPNRNRWFTYENSMVMASMAMLVITRGYPYLSMKDHELYLSEALQF